MCKYCDKILNCKEDTQFMDLKTKINLGDLGTIENSAYLERNYKMDTIELSLDSMVIDPTEYPGRWYIQVESVPIEYCPFCGQKLK